MPLQDPSPYEVLAVGPDAGVREINLAVGKAVRAGRFTRAQINDAAALLRKPARRLEIDVQRPLPPAPAADADAEGALAEPAAAPLPVPELPAWTSADLVAIHRARAVAQFVEPAPPDASPMPVPERYAADLTVLPPIEVPR